MNIIEKVLRSNLFYTKKDMPLMENLAAFFFSIKVKKKEILLKEGQINDKLIYIHKGLLRVYFIQEDGKEVNTWFAKEGEFVYASHSFHHQIPSEEYIETIEDSVIMTIRKETWLMLLRNNRNLAMFAIHELMSGICDFATQANLLRQMSSEKKYEYLKKHKKDIINRVSQKHLASYLGVDTTYLCKIINKSNN